MGEEAFEEGGVVAVECELLNGSVTSSVLEYPSQVPSLGLSGHAFLIRASNHVPHDFLGICLSHANRFTEHDNLSRCCISYHVYSPTSGLRIMYIENSPDRNTGVSFMISERAS